MVKEILEINPKTLESEPGDKVARERFELSSAGPKPAMLDHYTTGLRPEPTFKRGVLIKTLPSNRLGSETLLQNFDGARFTYYQERSSKIRVAT